MTVPQRLSMISLGVRELSASVRFYESLGWQRSSASNDSIAFFAMQGSVISLIHSDAIAADTAAKVVSVESTAVGLALNCDSAAEVDSVFAEFVAAGATTVSDPAYVFWGGYSAYVADLDGHLWEVAFNPGIPNDASGLMRLP